MRDFVMFGRHLLRMLHFVRGVLFVLLLVLLAFAAIAARVDGLSLPDALYFVLITALTIGYGDITPDSSVTQAISVLSGVVGVIFVGILVAVSVRALEHAVEEKRRAEKAEPTRERDP